jgi:hypothetical protein
MNILAQILTALAWPIVTLIIAGMFRRPLSTLISRAREIRASSKGIELILEQLEKKGQLPLGSRFELSGLSAHDIWALDDFAANKILPIKPAQRVIARTLADAGLLEISGEGPNYRIIVTPFGRQILETARTIPLNVAQQVGAADATNP